MKVKFVSTATSTELCEIESDDISGVIEAVKGEGVAFLDGVRTYNNHILTIYTERGETGAYLIIYVNDVPLK